MMENSDRPMVSVIIPVYNAKKYLARCLDSILAQTVEDIEIVAVNDCSTDDSLSLLQEYAMRDPRVTIVDKKNNEGSLMARHTGYNCARGRYFFFCDADDFMPSDALETLLDEKRRSGTDMVVADVTLYREDGKMMKLNRTGRKITSSEEYLRGIVNGRNNALYGILFRREIFDGSDYPAIIGFGPSDDRLLLTDILFKYRPSVTSIDKSVYYYFVNNQSMTRNKYTDAKLRAVINGLFTSYYALNNLTDEYREDYDRFMAKNLSFYIERGYSADIIMNFNDDARRLLQYSSMKALTGTRRAVHSIMCRKSRMYQRITDFMRQMLWRFKGKA